MPDQGIATVARTERRLSVVALDRRVTEPRDHRRAMLEVGVLPEHTDAALANFGWEVGAAVARFATEYARGTAKGMLIKGPVGTGKTRLAAAIVAGMITRGISARMLLARAFRRRLVESYRDENAERPGDVIRAMTTPAVLVLDDLAHEGQVSEAFVGDLHEVLTVRSGHFRPTIITTNLGLAEFGKLYDVSIESRLASFTQIVLDGDDWRRKRKV